MTQKIDPATGKKALSAWKTTNPKNHTETAKQTATAVRYTLQILKQLAPGHSVEVRIPPYGATQIITGTTHRRGTPPAVIEMTPDTWLKLATGNMTWQEALNQNLIRASGQRANLNTWLPLPADQL